MDFDDDKHLHVPQDQRGDKQHERRVKMLRKFREELRTNLNALSTTTQDRKRQVRGWPDVINIITQLQRTLQKYRSAGYIPERLLLGLRLGQTLNSQLPPGVHKKVLETYVLIFQIITGDDLARDLPIYCSGLLKLFPDASIDTKPLVLQLVKKNFISLPPPALRPCLSGLVCSLLPVLDEKNDLADHVWKMLNGVHASFAKAGLEASFMVNLWEALRYHAPSRHACAQYLISILPKSNQSKEQSSMTPELLGHNEALVTLAFKACLTSSVEFVVRAGLDLLTSSFMIHESGGLSDASKVEIAKCMLFLMARKELPLNRRITKWTSGSDTVYAYFANHAAPIIKVALGQLIEQAIDSLTAAKEVGDREESDHPPRKEAGSQLRQQTLSVENVIIKLMHHDLLGKYKEIQEGVSSVYLRFVLAMRPHHAEALDVLRTPVLFDCLGDYFPCRIRKELEPYVALPEGVILSEGPTINLLMAKHVQEVVDVNVNTPEIKRKRPLDKLLRLLWVVLLSVDNLVDDIAAALDECRVDRCAESVEIITILSAIMQSIATHYSDDLYAPPPAGKAMTGFETFFRALTVVVGRMLRTFHGELGGVHPRCEGFIMDVSLRIVEGLWACCEQVRSNRDKLVRDDEGGDDPDRDPAVVNASEGGSLGPTVLFDDLTEQLGLDVDAEWLQYIVELATTKAGGPRTTVVNGVGGAHGVASIEGDASSTSFNGSMTLPLGSNIHGGGLAAVQELAFHFRKLFLRICDAEHSLLPTAVVATLNERYLKQTITLVWGSVAATSKLLLPTTRLLIECSGHTDHHRQKYLNTAMLEDLKTMSEADRSAMLYRAQGAECLSEGGFTRFCVVWATTESLGYLNPNMLKDPMRQTLDTLVATDPIEKAKGLRFLYNTSRNVGRVLDPYLRILFNSQADTADAAALDYVLSALMSIVTACQNQFIAQLLAGRVGDELMDQYAVFSGGVCALPHARSYLAVLTGVCLTVTDNIDVHGEGMAGNAAQLLQAVYRRSCELRLAAHLPLVSHLRDEAARRVRPNLGSSLLALKISETLLVLLGYLQVVNAFDASAGAGCNGLTQHSELSDDIGVALHVQGGPQRDPLHAGSGSSFQGNAFQTPPTAAVVGSGGGVGGPAAVAVPTSPLGDTQPLVATLIPPLLEGLTAAAVTHNLYLVKQWSAVINEFGVFWTSCLKDVATQARAAVARIIDDLLPTPTPVCLDIIYELLDVLHCVGTWVHQRTAVGEPQTAAPKSQGGSGVGGMWGGVTDLFKGKSPTAQGDTVDSAALALCESMEDIVQMLNRVQMRAAEAAVQEGDGNAAEFNCYGESDTNRGVVSSLLGVLYALHPSQFMRSMLVLWGREVLDNSWGPLVGRRTPAQDGLLDLVLLIPRLILDDVLVGIIDVTTVAKQQKLKCYDVCGGDLLWHYLSVCPVSAQERLPKLMPMLIAWIKDMTSLQHAHIFAHVVYVRVVSRVVLKLVDVEKEGAADAAAASRAYLHDKRTSKDYNELFVRLIENVPKALLTQAWRRDEEDRAERTETALDMLARELKSLKENTWLASPDKIGPILLNLHQQYFLSLFKLGEDMEEDKAVLVRKKNIRKIHSSLLFLIEAVKVFALCRQLRAPLLEHINDNHFFRVDHTTLALWRRLFSLLVASDTAVKDMIQTSCSRIQLPTGVGSVFASALKESQNRAMALRRLAFQMICSGQHLTNLLPVILEKLIESTKHYADYPKVRSHILLCFRAILHKTDARSLAPFWPLIVTELMSILSQQSEENYLVIEALKVIDLARVVLPSDYHMYRWIFVEAERARTRVAALVTHVDPAAAAVPTGGGAVQDADDDLVADLAGARDPPPVACSPADAGVGLPAGKLSSLPTSDEASMTPPDDALPVGRPRTPSIHPGQRTPPSPSPAWLAAATPTKSPNLAPLQRGASMGLESALALAGDSPATVTAQYSSILEVLGAGVDDAATTHALDTIASLRVEGRYSTKGHLKPFLSVPEHRYDDMLKAEVVGPQLSAAFQEVSRGTGELEGLPDVVVASAARPDVEYIMKAFEMDLAQVQYSGHFDNLEILASSRPAPLPLLDLSQHVSNSVAAVNYSFRTRAGTTTHKAHAAAQGSAPVDICVHVATNSPQKPMPGLQVGGSSLIDLGRGTSMGLTM